MIVVNGKLFASDMYLEYSRISTIELFILFIVQIQCNVHSNLVLGNMVTFSRFLLMVNFVKLLASSKTVLKYLELRIFDW